MKLKNIYKPRYKIAFQSKSKIWAYKNSRLRRFFNIRGRKLVRRGQFKRISLVFNNMKWTVARRYIRPYMRSRKRIKRKYKQSFYLKQQVKNFYGKIKEEYFRNFFRKHLSSATLRNKSFYSALERRSDMFLYRTRTFPTIYAANQFVHHRGVNINGRLEHSPNALVRPGDILTFDSAYWYLFKNLLEHRITFRVYGLEIIKKRRYNLLKKKGRWLLRRNKRFKKCNTRILNKIYFFTKKFLHLFKKIENYSDIKNSSINKDAKSSTEFQLWKYAYILFHKNIKFIRKKFIAIRKLRKKTRIWKLRTYYKNFFYIISTWFSICKCLSKIEYSLKLYKHALKLQKIKVALTKKIVAEQDIELKNSWIKKFKSLLVLYNKKKTILDKSYLLFLAKIKENAAYFIKRRIQFKRGHKILVKKTESNNFTKYVRRNSLYYFLMRRRFKRKRQHAVPRLKKVHWYIPSYIYFDIRTIQAVFLYNPLPEEIKYSFKCSLPKIYSFYKSRGY